MKGWGEPGLESSFPMWTPTSRCFQDLQGQISFSEELPATVLENRASWVWGLGIACSWSCHLQASYFPATKPHQLTLPSDPDPSKLEDPGKTHQPQGLSLRFLLGFPGGSEVKASACNAGDLVSIPKSGRFPWRRKWQPTPVFWRIPWTEELGGSTGSVHGVPTVGHDWAT